MQTKKDLYGVYADSGITERYNFLIGLGNVGYGMSDAFDTTGSKNMSASSQMPYERVYYVSYFLTPYYWVKELVEEYLEEEE